MAGFSNVFAYDADTCNPTEVRGLRIYPPHEYDSMFVPNPGTGCANIPPDNQLSITTVKPARAPTGDAPDWTVLPKGSGPVGPQ